MDLEPMGLGNPVKPQIHVIIFEPSRRAKHQDRTKATINAIFVRLRTIGMSKHESIKTTLTKHRMQCIPLMFDATPTNYPGSYIHTINRTLFLGSSQVDRLGGTTQSEGAEGVQEPSRNRVTRPRAI
jgi:hypothetical protein